VFAQFVGNAKPTPIDIKYIPATLSMLPTQATMASNEVRNPSLPHRAFPYRPEVDGLRAVAVIPVVLFHAGFNGFGGGYIGVDIFFVISGYLITSIILSERASSKFTIVNFYERRARRILPALFLIMAVALPFAWLWMTPHHLKGFSQSLVATSAFVPNVYFFLKSGYFDVGVDEVPLLHTWSLGVEEQYYIVFPLFILLCWKWGLRTMTLILAVIAVISLGLSEWASRTHVTGNFYLPPTRAWELALGSLVAIASIRSPLGSGLPVPTRNAITIVGLLLILVPIFVFDRSTPFPGLYALVPTVGTAMVIAFAHVDTIVGRLLALRWVVTLGLISYSVYLWHQPIFVFARLHSEAPPSSLAFAALSLLAFALGYVTWRFVEMPVRNRRRFSRTQIFSAALCASAAFVGIGLTGHLLEGFPERLTAGQQEIMAFADDAANRERGYPGRDCFLMPDQNSAGFGTCVDDPPGAVGSVFLWGDSHAAHLYSGLRQALAGQKKLYYFTTSACPPIVGVATRGFCAEVNDFVLSKVLSARPDRLILAAVWGNYDWKQVERTLQRLQQAGITQVDVVGPVPRWYPSLPVVLTRFNEPFSKLPRRTTLGLDPEVAVIDAEMRELVERRGAHYISARSILCDAAGCLTRICDRVETMTQWDVSHLTPAGSDFLVARFVRGSSADMSSVERRNCDAMGPRSDSTSTGRSPGHP